MHRCGRAGRNKVLTLKDDETPKSNRSNCKATVYSFFHRQLAPMATDVVQLLSQTKAWIDPNLKALLPHGEKVTGEEGSRRKRRKKRKESLDIAKINVKSKKPSTESNEKVLSSDDEFASLALNRIVLQRAGNVSDEDSDSD